MNLSLGLLMGSASRLAVAASLSTLLLDFTTYLGGVAPYHYFDFVNNRALYASNDVGGVSSAPGYSFSRASAGYYTNLDGTLELFESGQPRMKRTASSGHNLLPQSQTFDNAGWSKNNSTVTANAATAPDGTTTADKLVENSATDFHATGPAVSVGTVTATECLSVFAKASERSWIALQLGASRVAYFNLSAGTIGTTTGSTTATITALANGWYRCAIAGVRETSQANTILLASADNTASYTGNGTNGVLLWGAQLNEGSTATAYVATTATPVYAPRRGDRGALIEGARTNLLLQSQTFDNAGWAKVNSTVTANSAAAPDGTTTAGTLTEGAVTDEHYAAQAVTKAATATTYTASVYAKSSTRNILIVCRQASVSANNATMGVNLTTGAVGLAAASAGTFAAASGVVTALANGWFRIAMTFTTSTETALSVRHYITDGTYNGGFAGNGTSGISIWGAQLEAASYPSSYIPTTTASATRAADNLVYTLPGIASGYSMWAQYADSPNGNSRVIDFGNTTLIRRSGGTHLNFNGAGLEGSAVGAFVSGKAAVAVDAAAVRAALNGASVSVTTGSYSAASQTAWNLGSTGTGSYLDGYISRVAYFNTALSGANLQTVTT